MQALAKNALMDGLEPSFEPESPEERAKRKADDYNASVGSLNQEDGYDCPICKNKGHVAYVGEKDAFGHPAEYFKPCKCCKVRNAIRRLNKSGLKNAVKELTFERFEVRQPWQQTIKDAALRFCQEGGSGWWFIGGQSGAGKSHICTAIAVHHIRQGKEVRYMVWREEAPRIKALVNEAEEYEKLMRELKTVDVLYIDDLFKDSRGADGLYRPPTSADIRLAFEIINYRYLNPALVTIISCEMQLTELDDIDEGVAGRIAMKSKPGGYCFSLKPDKAKNWRMQGITEL